MGHDPDQEPPFFFQKNPNNLIQNKLFPYPSQSHDVHHEVELMAALKKGGRNIAMDSALDCIWGYGVALDMTCRDLQTHAKQLGRPWMRGKAFESSSPCSAIRPVSNCGHPHHGAINLWVNGELRQAGDLSQQIWKVPEIITFLSRDFELAPGDIILTGTPAGVAAVHLGDKLEAVIEGVEKLSVSVVHSD
jgi:fumarylpyruvate hydrolase